MPPIGLRGGFPGYFLASLGFAGTVCCRHHQWELGPSVSSAVPWHEDLGRRPPPPSKSPFPSLYPEGKTDGPPGATARLTVYKGGHLGEPQTPRAPGVAVPTRSSPPTGLFPSYSLSVGPAVTPEVGVTLSHGGRGRRDRSLYDEVGWKSAALDTLSTEPAPCTSRAALCPE